MELNQLITKAQNMPNIPKIVQELIDSFGDENINTEQIASKVSQDQAMTAKVLRMANSAKYGGHRQVGTVNEATVLLGFNALRTLVLASGLTGAFTPPKGFDIKQFWKQSFTIASVSKWLAGFSDDIDNEIAFTCGMLHNIGGLLTHILANDQAQEVERIIAEGADRIKTESNLLGFTYNEAGAELATRWKFPAEIVNPIKYQLNPGSSDDYKPYAGIVYLATHLYNNRDNEDEILTTLPQDDIKQLNINVNKLESSLHELSILECDIDDIIN